MVSASVPVGPLRHARIVAARLIPVAVLSACTSGADDEPKPLAPREEPMRLDVLVYNVEYGGDESTDE
jgi:hypothetical protein